MVPVIYLKFIILFYLDILLLLVIGKESKGKGNCRKELRIYIKFPQCSYFRMRAMELAYTPPRESYVKTVESKQMWAGHSDKFCLRVAADQVILKNLGFCFLKFVVYL